MPENLKNYIDLLNNQVPSKLQQISMKVLLLQYYNNFVVSPIDKQSINLLYKSITNFLKKKKK